MIELSVVLLAQVWQAAALRVLTRLGIGLILLIALCTSRCDSRTRNKLQNFEEIESLVPFLTGTTAGRILDIVENK